LPPRAARAAPEPSAAARRGLAGWLRGQGRAGLAGRLESRPGPFLVSSLEPRLLPSSPDSPRLVADLSAVGSEYLYGVVDAFDRPIPAELQGRPEGLAAIGERLLALVAPAPGGGTGDWVTQVGGAPAQPAGGPVPAGAAGSQAGVPRS
jgi:hypothetical protein